MKDKGRTQLGGERSQDFHVVVVSYPYLCMCAGGGRGAKHRPPIHPSRSLPGCPSACRMVAKPPSPRAPSRITHEKKTTHCPTPYFFYSFLCGRPVGRMRGEGGKKKAFVPCVFCSMFSDTIIGGGKEVRRSPPPVIYYYCCVYVTVRIFLRRSRRKFLNMKLVYWCLIMKLLH